LINAMPRVVRAVPNTALLIIGDGPLRRELEAQVDELRLTDQVRFLGERPDVPELLSLLDVFVLCSHSEGLSLTLIEASAASLPIVATDVGGNSEVVEAGINGLLVPTNQPEPLAAAIIRLLTDKTTALRMGKAGSIKFEQEFTLDGMVWQYQQLYLACKRCSGSGDEFLS
jgi:glycosyltransferase involved in cell wall biosynthesis